MSLPPDPDARMDLPDHDLVDRDATRDSEAAAADHDHLVAHEMHPLAIRWMHWVNFPLLFIMMWSGLRIYWANDIYVAGIGTWEFFAFFPKQFYEVLDAPFKLAKGMAFHFSFGWLFALNGLAYVTYLAISGQWRHLVPDRRALTVEAPQVVAHDLHLRDEAPPQGRYNAAQQVTYTLVILMGALVVASGLAILKPTQATLLTTLLGGYEFARFLHFASFIGFALFFVLHVLQIARAGLGNFLSMITGYVLESRAADFDPQRRRGDDREPPTSDDSSTPTTEVPA